VWRGLRQLAAAVVDEEVPALLGWIFPNGWCCRPPQAAALTALSVSVDVRLTGSARDRG